MGNLEMSQEYSETGGKRVKRLDRSTLRFMADDACVLVVQKISELQLGNKSVKNNSSEATACRFQLNNDHSSSSLELDEKAQLISY